VVGKKDDPAAKALFLAARTWPASYARIEWLDRLEGPLPGSDLEFPTLPRAAAFACANGGCSSPLTDPTKIAEAITRVSRL